MLILYDILFFENISGENIFATMDCFIFISCFVSAADMSGNHSLIICSEEQFKVLSLPQLRIRHKEKLTAIDGSKVRKLEVICLGTHQGTGKLIFFMLVRKLIAFSTLTNNASVVDYIVLLEC